MRVRRAGLSTDIRRFDFVGVTSCPVCGDSGQRLPHRRDGRFRPDGLLRHAWRDCNCARLEANLFNRLAGHVHALVEKRGIGGGELFGRHALGQPAECAGETVIGLSVPLAEHHVRRRIRYFLIDCGEGGERRRVVGICDRITERYITEDTISAIRRTIRPVTYRPTVEDGIEFRSGLFYIGRKHEDRLDGRPRLAERLRGPIEGR